MILLLMVALAVSGLPACGSGSAPIVLSDPPPEGVEPVEAVYEAWGPSGGPFQGSHGPITVENQTSNDIEYEVTSDQNWVVWDVPSTGTLGVGESITASLSIDAATAPQQAGEYAATVDIRETSTDTLRATVEVWLVVQHQWQGAGFVGGPFAGSPDPVQITNGTAESYDYEISGSAAWIGWDVPSTGTVDASATLSMSLVVDTATAPTTTGTHLAELTVRDTATQRLRASVAVSLQVNAVPVDGSTMTTAHRTTGIAPLSVFFDAADTTTPWVWTSGVAQPTNGEYGRFHYTWDFGDTGAGNWSTNNMSRNAATGYTAAHVFHTPGTYTVRLSVEDPATGNTYNYEQDITVSAFSGTTYYVDAVNGSDSNNGTSESTAWQTMPQAFAEGVHTNARTLFRRGQTFTATERMRIDDTGPGILGAYGSGAKPILQFNGSEALNFRTENWRVMDLDIVGPGNGGEHGIEFVSYEQAVDILLWNLTVREFRAGTGILWSDWTPIFETPHKGNTIAECNIYNTNAGMYVGGRQQAILGNTVDGPPFATHSVRVWQAYKGAICHNVILDPSVETGRHALKLHGPTEGDGRVGRTQFVTITDNRFRGDRWVVSIGPQSNNWNEHLTQIVFERNWVESVAGTQIGAHIAARRVTLRNNVFDGENSAQWYVGVHVVRRGSEPVPQNVDVLNNTFYKPDTGSSFSMVEVGSMCEDINVRNNFGTAPSVGSASTVTGSCTRLVSTPNLLTDSPGFTNAASGDLSLTASSPAVDEGVEVDEVLKDYAGQTRGSSPDHGAYER